VINALYCGIILAAKKSENLEVRMKKKVWAHVARSYEDAQEFDDAYYLSMSSEERVETVQVLRERYSKMKKGSSHECRKRLRRVLRVIEQA